MNQINSLINFPLLTEQLKRFWAIGVALTLLYLVIGILPIYSRGSGDPWDIYLSVIDMVSLMSMSHTAAIVPMLIGPFAVVMALFPYHFSSSATTAFHSFPITKGQLFGTNAVAALILMLTPLLIFCLILLVPIHYPGSRELWSDGHFWAQAISFPAVLFPNEMEVGAVVNTFPVIAGFFARMAVGLIFYYSVFTLAASVTGNRVIAVLLCGALPLIPTGVHFLIEIIARAYVFGFDVQSGFSFGYTLAFSNPANWNTWIDATGIGRRLLDGSVVSWSQLWPYFLIYIGIIAVLLTLAYICSHKRKLERTGDSVVFTALKNVCVFLVAMFGTIMAGPFMLAITRSRTGMHIGFIIGFIIFYVIAQMIAEKSFYVVSKLKGLLPYGGIMAGLYVIMILITQFGMSFYINRVPEQHEVAGVTLSSDLLWLPLDERPVIHSDDPAVINRTLAIHQQIIDNRQYLQRVHWQGITQGLVARTRSVPFVYLLNNGTEIRRRYLVTHDFMISSGLGDLINSREMIIASNPGLRMPEVIETIALSITERYDWDDRHRDEQIIAEARVQVRAQVESLLAAIVEDFIAVQQAEWANTAAGNENIDWPYVIHPRTTVFRDLEFDEYGQLTPYSMLWLPSFGTDAKHTLAWLSENEDLMRD